MCICHPFFDVPDPPATQTQDGQDGHSSTSLPYGQDCRHHRLTVHLFLRAEGHSSVSVKEAEAVTKRLHLVKQVSQARAMVRFLKPHQVPIAAACHVKRCEGSDVNGSSSKRKRLPILAMDVKKGQMHVQQIVTVCANDERHNWRRA